MAMKLFHAWLSSASRRVRLCLAEKGIDYESVPVDLGRNEQHEPAFLAMNPDGVVPALRLDDGRSLHESSTICEYLDDLRPDPPLRPADPYARAVMRNFVRWTDEKALPHLLVLNWSLALQPAASRWTDAQLQERLARIPTPERREAWLRIARRPYTDEEKAEALAKLSALLPKMEAMLETAAAEAMVETASAVADGVLDGSTRPDALVGGRYSLADVAAVPFVARLAELAPPLLVSEAHPRVAAWWHAVRQRPAFALARIESFDAALRERAAA